MDSILLKHWIPMPSLYTYLIVFDANQPEIASLPLSYETTRMYLKIFQTSSFRVLILFKLEKPNFNATCQQLELVIKFCCDVLAVILAKFIKTVWQIVSEIQYLYIFTRMIGYCDARTERILSETWKWKVWKQVPHKASGYQNKFNVYDDICRY